MTKEKVSCIGIDQLVVFTVDGQSYGVDIKSVREIIKVPKITKVPDPLPNSIGILELRGDVAPVLSVHDMFGIPRTEIGSGSRILVFERKSGTYGVLVDSVHEVLHMEESEVVTLNENDKQWRSGILGFCDRQGKLVTILDMGSLMGS